MARLIAKRLVSMVFIIFALAAVMFLLQKLSRTSPVHAYLGANVSPQAIAKESKILGYDRPIPAQFLHYIWELLHGNFGESLRTRRPVRTDLATYLPATLELTVFGLFLAVVLGAFMGMASAARWRGSALLRLVMVAGSSAPTFLLALARDPALFQQAPLGAFCHRRHELHQRADWTDAYAGPRLPDPRRLGDGVERLGNAPVARCVCGARPSGVDWQGAPHQPRQQHAIGLCPDARAPRGSPSGPYCSATRCAIPSMPPLR